MYKISDGKEFSVKLNLLIDLLEIGNYRNFADKLKEERDGQFMPGDFYTGIGRVLTEYKSQVNEELIIFKVEELLEFISKYY